MSGDADRPRTGDAAETVLSALRRLARPATPAEVAEAAGLKEPSVRRTLGRLVALGDARRAGGGRFTAAKGR